MGRIGLFGHTQAQKDTECSTSGVATTTSLSRGMIQHPSEEATEDAEASHQERGNVRRHRLKATGHNNLISPIQLNTHDYRMNQIRE